jgi:hypothetical protein
MYARTERVSRSKRFQRRPPPMVTGLREHAESKFGAPTAWFRLGFRDETAKEDG